MNLCLPQCMAVRSKRATKTKELNSETGGIENGDGPRGAKLMIAGGEKNMMGLSELEDRQTDRHRQELLCLLNQIKRTRLSPLLCFPPAGVGFFAFMMWLEVAEDCLLVPN